MTTLQPLFGFFGLGTTELMVLLVLGVLLFGRNLPGIAKSIGKSVTEFKKGVSGVEDEVERTNAGGTAAKTAEPEQVRPPQRVSATAPKFEDAPPPQA
jgi:sec-independent protein translocase protein TatA